MERTEEYLSPEVILALTEDAVIYGTALSEGRLQAMLAGAPAVADLSEEARFASISRMLPHFTAQSLLRFAPIVGAAIPEVAPMIGFDQHSPHHAFDLFTHTACVVEAVPPDLTLRWAALLHDIGKVPTFTQDANGRGHFKLHAPVGARMADAALARMGADDVLRERAVWLIGRHMSRLQPEPERLRGFVAKYGCANAMDLLCLQEADMNSKGAGEGAGQTYAHIRSFLMRDKAGL